MRRKIKLIQTFMEFLVTCKNEEDPFKNEGARVVTTDLRPGSRGGGGALGPVPPPPARPLVTFFLPCKTIFLTLFKTSKIKPSCAAVRFLPLGKSA